MRFSMSFNNILGSKQDGVGFGDSGRFIVMWHRVYSVGVVCVCECVFVRVCMSVCVSTCVSVCVSCAVWPVAMAGLDGEIDR
jgi:hypothetical protein